MKYCPGEEDIVLDDDCRGCEIKECQIEEERIYRCVVCGIVPVDAENGFDTCDACSKNI